MVNCPKCATQVVVPAESESLAEAPSPRAGSQAAATATAPAPPSSQAATSEETPWIPREVLEIEPEDIRVELGINLDRPRTPPSPPKPPEVLARPVPELTVESLAASPAGCSAAPPPEPVVVPPIQIPPQPIVESRALPVAQRRDVVLPRSVVATWSLSMLLGLTLAFFAGLLAGHFIWKVH